MFCAVRMQSHARHREAQVEQRTAREKAERGSRRQRRQVACAVRGSVAAACARAGQRYKSGHAQQAVAPVHRNAEAGARGTERTSQMQNHHVKRASLRVVYYRGIGEDGKQEMRGSAGAECGGRYGARMRAAACAGVRVRPRVPQALQRGGGRCCAVQRWWHEGVQQRVAWCIAAWCVVWQRQCL